MKTKECCKPGEYKCQVPMPINGRRCEIDICIADIVAALNAANIKTLASCCGHGKDGTIVTDDGRELIIKWEDKYSGKHYIRNNPFAGHIRRSNGSQGYIKTIIAGVHLNGIIAGKATGVVEYAVEEVKQFCLDEIANTVARVLDEVKLNTKDCKGYDYCIYEGYQLAISNLEAIKKKLKKKYINK